MRKVILAIVAFIAPLLIGAFTHWSFDMPTWQDTTRFYTALAGITAAGIVYLELT